MREATAEIQKVAKKDPALAAAGAALLFCAPASAYITGQILYVDGGLTATR